MEAIITDKPFRRGQEVEVVTPFNATVEKKFEKFIVDHCFYYPDDTKNIYVSFDSFDNGNLAWRYKPTSNLITEL